MSQFGELTIEIVEASLVNRKKWGIFSKKLQVEISIGPRRIWTRFAKNVGESFLWREILVVPHVPRGEDVTFTLHNYGFDLSSGNAGSSSLHLNFLTGDTAVFVGKIPIVSKKNSKNKGSLSLSCSWVSNNDRPDHKPNQTVKRPAYQDENVNFVGTSYIGQPAESYGIVKRSLTATTGAVADLRRMHSSR